MARSSNVLLFTARPRVRADAAQTPAFEQHSLTTAAHAWQLQVELAWMYPRLCYAAWLQLMTRDR